MLKKLGNFVTVVAIIVILWFVASWADIISHNNPGGDDYKGYASWNCIEMMMNACHVDK